MQRQAPPGPGINAVMCYFPWFPFFYRHQIGFDIFVNPSGAEPGGRSRRWMHVMVYFPDGFICRPADVTRVPQSRTSRDGAPHFFLPRPHFTSPMYLAYLHTPPHVMSHIPLYFQEYMVRQSTARAFIYIINGQPGDFVGIDYAPCTLHEIHPPPAFRRPGLNSFMFYFPWLPYLYREQIAFDIMFDPVDGQPVLSLQEQYRRLIHLRIYFPDGFICKPASLAGLETPFLRCETPQFTPPQLRFQPPVIRPSPEEMPLYENHLPMDFQRLTNWQSPGYARVIVYIANGEPGDSVTIDNTPYDVIPQCQICCEFHTEPEYTHDRQPHNVSGCPWRHPSAPGTSRQHAGTPGTTGRRNTAREFRHVSDELKRLLRRNHDFLLARREERERHEALRGVPFPESYMM